MIYVYKGANSNGGIGSYVPTPKSEHSYSNYRQPAEAITANAGDYSPKFGVWNIKKFPRGNGRTGDNQPSNPAFGFD